MTPTNPPPASQAASKQHEEKAARIAAISARAAAKLGAARAAASTPSREEEVTANASVATNPALLNPLLVCIEDFRGRSRIAAAPAASAEPVPTTASVPTLPPYSASPLDALTDDEFLDFWASRAYRRALEARDAAAVEASGVAGAGPSTAVTPGQGSSIQLRVTAGEMANPYVSHNLDGTRIAPEAVKEMDITTTLQPQTGTVLEALRAQVAALFDHGPYLAAVLLTALSINARTNDTILEGKVTNEALPKCKNLPDRWTLPCLPTLLVLLFSCRKESMIAAAQFQSPFEDRRPSPEAMRVYGSASLEKNFRAAKHAALSKKHKTAVIGVAIIDIRFVELEEQRVFTGHSSFDHSFAMAIAPQGVAIWQAGGQGSYDLEDYLKRGEDRIRTWKEADEFVADFEKLVSQKGPWTFKLNKLFKKLFGVDINHICGPNGMRRPIVNKWERWINLCISDNIRLEDVNKFEWR